MMIMMKLEVKSVIVRMKIFWEPGSICAIAASEHSVDTVWFIRTVGEFESTADVT